MTTTATNDTSSAVKDSSFRIFRRFLVIEETLLSRVKLKRDSPLVFLYLLVYFITWLFLNTIYGDYRSGLKVDGDPKQALGC